MNSRGRTWSWRTLLVLLVCVLCPPAAMAQEGDATPSYECEHLEEWLPSDVLLVARLRAAGPGLKSVLESSYLTVLERSSIGATVADNPQLAGLLAAIETLSKKFDEEPAQLATRWFGNEVALGVRVGLAGVQYTAMTRMPSETAVQTDLATLRSVFVEQFGAWPFNSGRDYGGVRIESAPNLSYAVIGKILVLSNTQVGVAQVIDRASGRKKDSVRSSEAFAPARTTFDGDALLAVAFRRSALPNLGAIEGGDNFLQALLIGVVGEALRDSELFVVGLHGKPDGVVLEVEAVGEFANGVPGYPLQGRPSARAQLLESLGTLGFVHLQRDFGAWWPQGEKRIKPAGVAGMRQFASIISLVFGGRGPEEIFESFGKSWTIIFQNQSYSGMPSAPQPAIPSIALYFEIAPELGADRSLQVALQTLVGLRNVDQAQKGMADTLVLVEQEMVGDTRIHVVNPATLADPEKAPRYERNFTPTLATVGDGVVISSTRELAIAVVKKLQNVPAKQESNGGYSDRLWVEGEELQKLILLNNETLLANNMLENGHSIEEARAELRQIMEVVSWFRDVELTSKFGEGGLAFSLRVRLRPAVKLLEAVDSEETSE